MGGDLSSARETAGWYKEVFGDRYYLELMHHEGVPGQDDVNKAVNASCRMKWASSWW